MRVPQLFIPQLGLPAGAVGMVVLGTQLTSFSGCSGHRKLRLPYFRASLAGLHPQHRAETRRGSTARAGETTATSSRPALRSAQKRLSGVNERSATPPARG